MDIPGWRRQIWMTVTSQSLVIVIALAAVLLLVCHLDPAGSYPAMPAGAGLTVDESFNVQQGVVLVEAVRNYGFGLFTPEGVRDVFQPPLHLPDHPPLGRFWLGLHHHLAWWLFPPTDPETPFNTACARAGSATAFGLTILLVGGCATIWYGRWAGVMTALGFLMIPRLWGHAHLAALETCTNLTCTAATLAVAAWWRGPAVPTLRTAAMTGCLLGLALLTKIQAVPLPVPIIVWAFLRWRWRAISPLCIWGLTGVAVFIIGWPWLWLAPWEHLLQYLRGAANRIELSVWFAGVKYTDRSVPVTYVISMFLATLPFWMLTFGVFGCLGKIGREAEPAEAVTPLWRLTSRDALLIAAAIWPLLFFSLPRIPVYDCERLWLTAFPYWILLTGRGAAILSQFISRRIAQYSTRAHLIWLTLVLGQIVWLQQTVPVFLSDYSMSVGGSRGAASLDLERNYWGDAITRQLLERVVQEVPRETDVAMSPVLHQFQVEEYWRQSPILRRHGVRIVPYQNREQNFQYLLLFQRRADLPTELLEPSEDWEPIEEVKTAGVIQAGFYRRRSASDKTARPEIPPSS